MDQPHLVSKLSRLSILRGRFILGAVLGVLITALYLLLKLQWYPTKPAQTRSDAYLWISAGTFNLLKDAGL